MWGEFRVGWSFVMDDEANLYGEISYRQALDHDHVTSLGFNAGVKLKW